jgi:hypothetical protein
VGLGRHVNSFDSMSPVVQFMHETSFPENAALSELMIDELLSMYSHILPREEECLSVGVEAGRAHGQ